MAQFRVLAYHFYGGAEENYDACQNSRHPGLDEKREAAEYKEGALPVQPKWPLKCGKKVEGAELKES